MEAGLIEKQLSIELKAGGVSKLGHKNKVVVRIVKDWNYPDGFFLQTPGGSKRWGEVEFTEDPIALCDYLIVLQRPAYDIDVSCIDGNAWLITQEPPVDYFKFYKKSFKYFDKVFTYYQDTKHQHTQSLQPVLPWHVLKSYDELTGITKAHLKEKKDELVWITSNRSSFSGHQVRLAFKDYLQVQNFKFSLYGQGFHFIRDKFDGLFPHKYALAIENFSVQHYWTEKLADCFLSWCLPFYWGAPGIEHYFPEQSFIRIDIHKPDEAMRIIQHAIKNREWERRLSAIEQARNLVLNKYQFFPYVSQMITEDLKQEKKNILKEYRIPKNPYPYRLTLINQLTYYGKRILSLFIK